MFSLEGVSHRLCRCRSLLVFELGCLLDSLYEQSESPQSASKSKESHGPGDFPKCSIHLFREKEKSWISLRQFQAMETEEPAVLGFGPSELR